VSGSGISWDICKSATHFRQITMPAPHHSVFTGRMPFLPPKQQCQSTEGTESVNTQKTTVPTACWIITSCQLLSTINKTRIYTSLLTYNETENSATFTGRLDSEANTILHVQWCPLETSIASSATLSNTPLHSCNGRLKRVGFECNAGFNWVNAETLTETVHLKKLHSYSDYQGSFCISLVCQGPNFRNILRR